MSTFPRFATPRSSTSLYLCHFSTNVTVLLLRCCINPGFNQPFELFLTRHSYRQTSVCFSLVNMSFIIRDLSQEFRRVEGKLFSSSAGRGNTCLYWTLLGGSPLPQSAPESAPELGQRLALTGASARDHEWFHHRQAVPTWWQGCSLSHWFPIGDEGQFLWHRFQEWKFTWGT